MLSVITGILKKWGRGAEDESERNLKMLTLQVLKMDEGAMS